MGLAFGNSNQSSICLVRCAESIPAQLVVGCTEMKILEATLLEHLETEVGLMHAHALQHLCLTNSRHKTLCNSGLDHWKEKKSAPFDVCFTCLFVR